MVIVAHCLLGIDGCRHHLCLVARNETSECMCSSALHVVDWKRFLSVLLNTPELSSDLCFPSLLLSRAASATNLQHFSYSECVT